MHILFKKTFAFSACYSQGSRVLGRNYRLSVQGAPDRGFDEEAWVAEVERTLIRKLHTSDLGSFEGIPAGTCINDAVLLEAFWRVLEKVSPSGFLRSLTLERDDATSTTLSGGAG